MSYDVSEEIHKAFVDYQVEIDTKNKEIEALKKDVAHLSRLYKCVTNLLIEFPEDTLGRMCVDKPTSGDCSVCYSAISLIKSVAEEIAAERDGR